MAHTHSLTFSIRVLDREGGGEGPAALQPGKPRMNTGMRDATA